MHKHKISVAVVLPRREKFSSTSAGAVSLVVEGFARKSRFRDSMAVLGANVESTFDTAEFIPVKPDWWNPCKSSAYVSGAAKALAGGVGTIEIHNRPEYVKYFKRKMPKAPLLLYLHNDPRSMRGAKSPLERQVLGAEVQAVVCVSSFVKRCFLEGTEKIEHKAVVVNNAVDTSLVYPLPSAQRRNEIIFVGRTIPDKGAHLLAEAAEKLLPRFPEWKIVVVGGRYFGSSKMEEYELALKARMERLGAQAEMTGYLPRAAMLDRLRRASIAVLPSIWDEPCGLVHIEAAACGCAIVTTRRGGIPEMLGESALYLDEESPQAVERAVLTLLENPSIMLDCRQLSRARAEKYLDMRPASQKLDDIRSAVM
jgi:glycosyltransferase involved in cell wall biosynthesis